METKDLVTVKCDRCHLNVDVIIMSWFTTELICTQCNKEEYEIKQSLPFDGKNFKGCGYIPDIKIDIFK